MDMSIVRSYLKTSFDNFRLSYGYKVRPENKTLSVLCTEDAKKLTTNKGKYVNNDPKATQIDNFIPYFCFGNVDTKKMDINRVIADSFFYQGDILVARYESAWAPPIGFYQYLLKSGFVVRALYYEPMQDFCGIFDNGEEEHYSSDHFNEIPAELKREFVMDDFIF